MLRAPVPETPVDKDRQPSFHEHEVRVAINAAVAPPTGDVVHPEQTYQTDFSRPISPRLNFRHDP